jgi:predicted transcriptional regulator
METDSGSPSIVPLGPLERQMHQAVRVRGTATVREVLQDKNIWQRYNTVLTTMDRLYQKGLLGRTLEGKSFRYWVRCIWTSSIAKPR